MADSQGCEGCRTGDPFPVDFTMAFQPIVDFQSRSIWGYEALVRGVNGEGAGTVLGAVNEHNRYKFDQACRVKAVELAGRKMPAGSNAMLAINFMPNAVYEPSACIRATLAAAHRTNFNPRRLMFEFTENEYMADTAHVENIVATYRQLGFTTALDDFGAGYAGLGLLARFQPDLIKIDEQLIRGISTSRARRVIMKGIIDIANALNIRVLAEGLESEAELLTLTTAGIKLFQGYLFGEPELETFRHEKDIAILRAAA